jgi:hypothetical protein
VNRGIAIRKIRRQLPTRPRYKLRSSAASCDKNRGRGVKLSGQSEQVAVESPAQPFVRADENHSSFSDRTHFQQRMVELNQLPRGGALNPVEQTSEGTLVQRGLLGLAHFGGGHHLHRLGDLSCAGNRTDPAPNIASAGHN